MHSGLSGLLSQAERVARKRGQPLTTAHLLSVLCERTAVAGLLREHGVTEAALLDGGAGSIEEHANVLPFACTRAERIAGALHSRDVDALHLLLALVRDPRSRAYVRLTQLGVRPGALQSAVRARLTARAEAAAAERPSPAPHARPPRERVMVKGSRRAAMAEGAQLRLAVETETRRAKARRPGTENGTGTEGETGTGAATGAEAEAGARTGAGAGAGAGARTGVGPGIGVGAGSRAGAGTASVPVARPDRFTLDPERFPLLTSLGRNLSAAAAAGQIDAVLGRDHEIEQVLDVLCRRRANNPVLVGPSGVGKTAIVHGVALALARGRARSRDAAIVIELSSSALLSGTSVRGALAERLQGLIQEVARSERRIVLFIDEIHTIIAAEDGADTLSGGLKAELARGGLPCIGATTENEYRRVFERDAALSRRFTRVPVDEPSPEATRAILVGVAPDYERHHGVTYDAAAIHAAIDLSVRYMSERHLPDKAIALLDQAGARVQRRAGKRVTAQAVAEVVSELSAVPLERLLMRDADALLGLEEHLARRVVGQPEATAAIADALRKSAAGFRGARPLGTFLLLGPTGVGKTEMAKAIAELLFPGAEPTRVDMSELSEAHTVARLLGAPPGYIAHDEGGQLTEPVRRRPYQLILLDEVEKAHRDVLLALLPLLDEGRLTDGRGRTVDFRNTVIVMTSNLGVASAPRGKVGFGAQRADGRDEAAIAQRTLAAARAALPPELWNRIDEPLYFRALDRDAIARIAERMIAGVAALMQREHAVHVELDPSAIDALIAAGGYDPELGARPMRRTVSRLIEAPLARAILRGELPRACTVVVRGAGDQIVLTRTLETAVAAE